MHILRNVSSASRRRCPSLHESTIFFFFQKMFLLLCLSLSLCTYRRAPIGITRVSSCLTLQERETCEWLCTVACRLGSMDRTCSPESCTHSISSVAVFESSIRDKSTSAVAYRGRYTLLKHVWFSMFASINLSRLTRFRLRIARRFAQRCNLLLLAMYSFDLLGRCHAAQRST